ncbi:hypothetical protein ACQCN2_15045 [Brevibacillus ginsengisoli]
MTTYQCFHCEHETESVHLISFFQGKQDREELLCDECYVEWLHSIKG